MTATFGGFNLSDGVSYYVLERSFDYPEVKETLFKVARYDGMKKTGQSISERNIPLVVKVVGVSRADLESKLDALYAALSMQQQLLLLHTLDNRAYTADTISAKTTLSPGSVLSATVAITFLCQNPFAKSATASTFSVGPALLTLVSGTTYTFATQTFSGGGTNYAYPLITLTNNTAANNNTLGAALTNGGVFTSLTVSALAASVAVGDTFILTSGTHTQSVVASATRVAGATTLAVTSFTANFAYPITTTTVNKNCAWTAFSVQQTTDSQTISGVAGLPVVNGDYIQINCDPGAASSGWTVTKNGGATVYAFTGEPPVVEDTTTTWVVQVTSPSVPTATALWTWTPQWLS